jgi:hypothetical protein
LYDQILFGLTSATSLMAAVVITAKLHKFAPLQRGLWAISFGILCVLAAEIAVYGLGILSQPVVNPAASLIPGFLAAGLLRTWKRRVGFYYICYIVAVFVALLAATLLADAPPLAFVVFVHLPSGLVIFVLPIYTTLTKRTNWKSLMVSAGGLLIGIAGMGLATLSAGVPILPASIVTDLIAPVFLAMTALIALGIPYTNG